jgi:hypothetical protein
MVPLQAGRSLVFVLSNPLVAATMEEEMEHTELLLDDLQDLLLVKLLGKTLNSSQSLTTIALYTG